MQNFLPLELFLFWIMILLCLVGCELSSLLWYIHKHHSFCKESLITFIKKKNAFINLQPTSKHHSFMEIIQPLASITKLQMQIMASNQVAFSKECLVLHNCSRFPNCHFSDTCSKSQAHFEPHDNLHRLHPDGAS